jgi:hypothetical protein
MNLYSKNERKLNEKYKYYKMIFNSNINYQIENITRISQNNQMLSKKELFLETQIYILLYYFI